MAGPLFEIAWRSVLPPSRIPPQAVQARRPAALALALALPAAALAWQGDAAAQESATGLRPALTAGAPENARSKPAYRGSYKRVGKPVREGKSTVTRPARGVADIVSPGSRPLAPAVGAVPEPMRAAPALPLPEPSVRRKRKEELDPFAPVGITAGAFVLRPSIDTSAGFASNPDQVAGARKGSWFARSEGALQVDSEWERHAFAATLRGGYSDYFDVQSASRPDADAAARLRLDVLRDTVVDFGGTARLTTQSPGLEQPIVGSRRALILDTGLTAGVTQTFGRLSFGIQGGLARSEYGSLTLADGTTLDQSDRNVTGYALRLRTGYEISPFIKPFVEATIDQRVRDEPLDSAGFRRSSSGYAVRTGATLAFSELLTGEVSAGYAHRDYRDPRLAPVGAALLDASLLWSPTALTTVALRAGSAIEETSVTGSSGAVVHKAAVEVNHALRRNLSVGALVEATRTDYQGVSITEDRLSAGVKLDYKLSRSVVVRASAAHERLQSSIPGSDYTANVYMLGLRLQR